MEDQSEVAPEFMRIWVVGEFDVVADLVDDIGAIAAVQESLDAVYDGFTVTYAEPL